MSGRSAFLGQEDQVELLQGVLGVAAERSLSERPISTTSERPARETLLIRRRPLTMPSASSSGRLMPSTSSGAAPGYARTVSVG